MKILDRIVMNHIELGIHPRFGAFFFDIAIFGMGAKLKFSILTLKKALQTKWIGFFYGYEQGALFITLLGIEILFWIYKD